MAHRSPSVRSGGSNGPRRPRSPPSMYVAHETIGGNGPKPLLPRKEKPAKPPKRSNTFQDSNSSGGDSSPRGPWFSSTSLSSLGSSKDEPASSSDGRRHQAKTSISSLFGLRRKASSNVLLPATVPESNTEAMVNSAPARDLTIAPWDSPVETTFPSHPAVTPRSPAFPIARSPEPEQYRNPRHFASPQPRYQSPTPQRPPVAVSPIQKPIPVRPLAHSDESFHSISHLSGSASSSDHSHSLEMSRPLPHPIRLRTQSDSSESVIDIKPVKIARKAPPPVTMEVTSFSPEPPRGSERPESPTTPRVLLSPRPRMQALRLDKPESKSARRIIPQKSMENISLTTRRREVKDGWSGEWNTSNMEDVISRLRSLR